MEAVVVTESFKSFRGQRVLITGDTGFKGSWLALWLSSLGAEVTGFALPPEDELSHFSLLRLDSRIRHITGDVREPAGLRAAVEAAKPQFVFHLAAQSLVRQAFHEPKRTFDTNVGGTVNLFEAIRGSSDLKAAVIVTSDKCYRNKEWIWSYRENDELGGSDPYSASKAATEHVAAAYGAMIMADWPTVGIATVRAGNVIGGGDWAKDRIIPDCIRALKQGRPIVLRNPAATRPWQHVLEPVSGYLTLALHLARDPSTFAGAWNFGPAIDNVRTVVEVAHEAARHWGSGTIEVERIAGAPPEHHLLQLNIDKAMQVLHWRPRWTTSVAVEKAILWYRQVLGGQSATEVGLRQIAEYGSGA